MQFFYVFLTDLQFSITHELVTISQVHIPHRRWYLLIKVS